MHGRGGEAESGVAICDLPDATRCYARFEDGLADAEREEWVGRAVDVTTDGEINRLA